jgi:hypothetical protein
MYALPWNRFTEISPSLLSLIFHVSGLSSDTLKQKDNFIIFFPFLEKEI